MNDKDFPIRPRPELDRFEAYQPGTSISEFKRRYGLKEVFKLASNENPLGPSPKAIKALKKSADEVFRYPESRSVDLRRAVADRYQLDMGQVIIGNGSDEIIELLAKAYLTPQDEIIVSASAFLQYKIAGNLMGAKVVTIPLKDMKCDLKAMAMSVTPATKFVFLANPNNPTGTYNTRAEIDRFLSLLPSTVVPVFDEAYYEFAAVNEDYPTMLQGLSRNRPMVVLRTFSKAYGLAGLRVGFGVAPAACVATLDKIRPPFNVSAPAQAAAHAAMFDAAHLKKTVANNEKEKNFLTEELLKMQFTVVPSAANFILFHTGPHTGRWVYEELLRKSIIARSVDEYGLPDYLRVSVGTSKENKKFLAALREVTNKQ